jgi:ferredoxin-NADP reductase
MIKYLIDNKQKRDIAMVYSNKTVEDIAYKNFLDTASMTPLPLKMTYTLTDTKNLSTYWEGCSGHITEQMIQNKIPDFKDRMFYVSGPHKMVSETEQLLKNLGVKNRQIKVDFFPGFA